MFLVRLFFAILFHEVQAICLSIAHREYQTLSSQNSSEKPNSIQITHKALSIFLLHVTHDKVSLSKQMTISHGF